jgi:hypothetical protein
MAKPWIGVQKLAVVPTFNRQFDTTPLPSDWDSQIMRRVLYDPDPSTGVDRSLRSYISAISYGRAILEAKLFPHAHSDGPSVVEAAYNSLPSGHGYPYVLCVIPWYDGGVHRKGWFRTVGENGVIAVSRVAMFEGPLQLKQRFPTGVWAMEVLHAIADLPDLYPKSSNPYPKPPIGNFDNMCYSAGTHNCAYLKQAAGWLSVNNIVKHASLHKDYKLHAVGISPPPLGRVAAVSIASRGSSEKFIVEARLKADVYERGFAPLTNGKLEFQGLPGEGVIVYKVKPPHLKQVKFVAGPLAIDESYSNSKEGLTITPTATLDDGIALSISRKADSQCAGLLKEIALKNEGLKHITDPYVRRQAIAARNKLIDKAKKLGCY